MFLRTILGYALAFLLVFGTYILVALAMKGIEKIEKALGITHTEE